MAGLEGSGIWIAGAAIAAACALVVAVVIALARRRRTSLARAVEPSVAAELQAETVLNELVGALEEAHSDLERSEHARERAQRESERLRVVCALGRALELPHALEAALETAAKLATAAASMVVVQRGEGEPLVASFGLAAHEASAALVPDPPERADVSAVVISYRYTAEQVEQDELRLRSGVALPLFDGAGERIGTLGVFSRRRDWELSDDDHALLELTAAAIGPAVANAIRFEEVSARTDTDPVTGLRNRRYFEDALGREYARARRHERRLGLLALGVHGEDGAAETLLSGIGAALQSGTRRADHVCHVGDGAFAVLLPEAGEAAAELVFRRVRDVAEATASDERVRLAATTLELGPRDDADLFRARVAHALAEAGSR